MHLIGITGFIGSGKTTIGQLLKDMGYVVFDMDVWCRKMYFEKVFLEVIKQNFPQSFEGGVFNKKKLRQIVFKDEKQLKKLESLTHPYLKSKLLKLIHKNRFNSHLFFVETALLFQMELDKYCRQVILTTAPYDVMEKRVILRDKVSAADFKNIYDKQKIDLLGKSFYDINTYQSINTLKTDVIRFLESFDQC